MILVSIYSDKELHLILRKKSHHAVFGTGVCVEIERENPDVIFLQEVVSDSIAIIESKLINYKFVQAGGDGYFVAMLLKNSTGVGFWFMG